MNCNQAKSVIALWVGNDLDEAAAFGVRRHVSECPHCREHWQQLKACMCALQDAGETAINSLEDSIWPGVETAIAVEENKADRFNGWVPALAVAAALLAMFSITQTATRRQAPLETQLVIFPWTEPHEESGQFLIPNLPGQQIEEPAAGIRFIYSDPAQLTYYGRTPMKLPTHVDSRNK